MAEQRCSFKDTIQYQAFRGRSIARLKAAFPDYVPLIGGLEKQHQDHRCPFTLITLVRWSLRPATNVLLSKELRLGDQGWGLDGGRYLGDVLPEITGGRGHSCEGQFILRY